MKSYKKRFFCLKEDKQLRYYDGAKEKGTIDLATVTTVAATQSVDHFDFDVTTPTRVYHLRADSHEQRQYWVKGLNKILNPPTVANKGKGLLAGAKKKVKDTEKKLKHGDKTDEEISAAEKARAKQKAKEAKEKEKLAKEKQKLKLAKEKEKLAQAKAKERERHQAAKDNIKKKESKLTK